MFNPTTVACILLLILISYFLYTLYRFYFRFNAVQSRYPADSYTFNNEFIGYPKTAPQQNGSTLHRRGASCGWNQRKSEGERGKGVRDESQLPSHQLTWTSAPLLQRQKGVIWNKTKGLSG